MSTKALLTTALIGLTLLLTGCDKNQETPAAPASEAVAPAAPTAEVTPTPAAEPTAPTAAPAPAAQ